MSQMWNIKDLKQPPVSSDQYAIKALNKEKLRKVHSQLFDCQEICYKQTELLSELEILTKLHYKFKNQWRREKCLRNVKQIQVCLKRWFDIKLDANLRQLLDLVPSTLAKSKADPYVRLPSACMIEFTMLRLLGAAKLLQKTAEICTTAFQNVTAQLSGGLFIQNMTIVAATVSRVWILVRYTQRELCKCYSVLQTWLPELKPPTVSMITKENPLPTDIFSWLEPEPSQSVYRMSSIVSVGIHAQNIAGLDSGIQKSMMANLVTLDHGDQHENSKIGEEMVDRMAIKTQISRNNSDTSKHDDPNDDVDVDDDFGVVLDRSAFEAQMSINNSSTLKYADQYDVDIGVVLDRSAFETPTSIPPYSKPSRVSNESDISNRSEKSKITDLSPFTSPAFKEMKKFLKSVDRLSSGDESADSTPPKKKRKYVRLSVEEYRQWSLEVLSCTSIVNVRGFLRKLNHAYPLVDFRGMTKCLVQLKAIEPSRRKMGKDVDVRRKKSKKIMREATKIVKAMLKLNYTKTLKARNEKKE